VRIRVQKWGNSLAVRIPRSFARETSLKEGGEVELELENGRLMITPVSEREYDLLTLLAQVTPEMLHGEVETGGPEGKEVW
jgi:antitoxin MazE